MEKSVFVAFLVAIAIVLFVSSARGADEKFTGIKNRLMTKLHGKISKAEIENIFDDNRVKTIPELLKKLERARKGIGYFSPELGFFTSQSIARGKEELRKNKTIFSGVEEKYGVDKEVLAGILRIETDFGGNVGSTNVFNALLTFQFWKIGGWISSAASW